MPWLWWVEGWGLRDVRRGTARFLKEALWERLAMLRVVLPQHLSADAVAGLQHDRATHCILRWLSTMFVAKATAAGVDIFRIFYALNTVQSMR